MRAGPLLPIRVLALSQDVPAFTECQDNGSTPGTLSFGFFQEGCIYIFQCLVKNSLSHQGFRAAPVWGVLDDPKEGRLRDRICELFVTQVTYLDNKLSER